MSLLKNLKVTGFDRTRFIMVTESIFIRKLSIKMLPCDNIDTLSLQMCHFGKLRHFFQLNQ